MGSAEELFRKRHMHRVVIGQHVHTDGRSIRPGAQPHAENCAQCVPGDRRTGRRRRIDGDDHHVVRNRPNDPPPQQEKNQDRSPSCRATPVHFPRAVEPQTRAVREDDCGATRRVLAAPEDGSVNASRRNQAAARWLAGRAQTPLRQNSSLLFCAAFHRATSIRLPTGQNPPSPVKNAIPRLAYPANARNVRQIAPVGPARPVIIDGGLIGRSANANWRSRRSSRGSIPRTSNRPTAPSSSRAPMIGRAAPLGSFLNPNLSPPRGRRPIALRLREHETAGRG